MSKDDCSSSGAAVLSFLAGTVVGAAIALLTAPRSGQQTREMLSGYGEDLVDKMDNLPAGVREYGETAIERSKNMIEHGKNLINRGTELASQGKEFLDEKKEALSEAIEAGKRAMEEERKALSNIMKEEE
ncbi:MAG: YtxH domain-containing protein [Desulfobulbaceae bacterium]|nr:YtxH domain-containing protein [Desulfobulbaceae bacterium]HIJ79976.1 YtxH domain-containing protein [Deltaproteobacteria bacterium]